MLNSASDAGSGTAVKLVMLTPMLSTVGLRGSGIASAKA
jgi:hypothetical protein